MYFRTLGLILLMVSQLSFARGRGPAVEDFVGIEVEHPEGTPQGTEGLFNFENDIHKFEKVKSQFNQTVKPQVTSQAEGPSDTATTVVIFFVLGLPGIIWFLMMHHLRQKAHLESASNIAVLETYRKNRQDAKKAQEEFKKVS
jgi:hypothetical protein